MLSNFELKSHPFSNQRYFVNLNIISWLYHLGNTLKLNMFNKVLVMNITKSLKIVHKTTPNKHSIPTNDINTTKTRMRGRTIYCLNSTQLLSLSSLHKRHILILNHICIWWSKLCAHLRCIQSLIRWYFEINNEFQMSHLISMITVN